MICKNLWEQHRETYSVLGYELRWLRYCDYNRAIEAAGITALELGYLERLRAKVQLGEELDPEEISKRNSIIGRMPVEEFWACCFVSPKIDGGAQLRQMLFELRTEDRETLRMWLSELTEAIPSGYAGFEEAGIFSQLGIPLAKDLDSTSITVQQANALFIRLKAAADAVKAAQGAQAEG